MVHIVLTHWRAGLQKVSLAKLQVELLHLPLREAKANVDQLLEGRIVLLEVADEEATAFMNRADILGADVGVVKYASATGMSNRLASGLPASAEVVG